MHCGWMEAEDWPPGPAELPPSIGTRSYDLDICPGWVVRQPTVGEACEVFAALDAGALAVAYPDLTQEQWEAAMALRGAWESFKAESMKKPNGTR